MGENKHSKWLSFFDVDPEENWRPDRLGEINKFNPFLLMDLYLKSDKFRKAMDERQHILIEGMLFPTDSLLLIQENGKTILSKSRELITRNDYVIVRYGAKMPFARPGEIYMGTGNGRVLNIREPLGDSTKQQMKTYIFKDTGFKSFGELVEYHRKRCKMTQHQLAEKIGLSDDRSLRAMETSSSPQIGRVIALCIIFRLDPDDGNELVRAAGYTFKDDPQGRAYRYIVNTLTQGDLSQINHFLEELDLKPLTA